MTDKELKHLKRQELLEIILESEKNNETLKGQIEEQQIQIEDLEEKLANRRLELNEAGNIAEASIRINKVFEAAQEAVADYLINIRSLSHRQEAICKQREAESKQKADAMIAETEAICDKARKETDDYCENTRRETLTYCEQVKKEALEYCVNAKEESRKEVETYWSSLTQRMEDFYDAHKGMREILSFYDMKLPTFGRDTREI